MDAQRKWNEPGLDWEDISLAEAIEDLEGGGYWKEGTTEEMLRAGTELWTPWANYRIEGATPKDEPLDGVDTTDITSAMNSVQPSFYPSIAKTLREAGGREKVRKHLNRFVEEEGASVSEAIKWLESLLSTSRNLPPAWYRARIAALGAMAKSYKQRRDKHPEGSEDFKKINRQVRRLINGVFPPRVDGQQATEKMMEKMFPKTYAAWKAGKQINDTPLTFEELARYNTWFVIYPERILGEQGFDTSRGFPISVTGPEEEAQVRLAEMPIAPERKEVVGTGPAPAIPVTLNGTDCPCPDDEEEIESGGLGKPGRKTRPNMIAYNLVRKFTAMNGKAVSKAQVAKLLDEVQGVIKLKKVRKGSAHARDVVYMQKKLAEWEKALFGKAKGKVEINSAWLRDFNNVIQWKGRKPGEVLLEEFLDLLGRGGKAKEIRSLCYVIQRALKKGRITEPYKEVAQKVLRILLRAGADGVEKLKAQRRVVNEVRAALGLPGLNGPKQETALDGLDEDGFISADAIPDNSHLRYHFEGRYGEIFRAPVRGFWTMIFGREKSGKSTLVLDFAGYLARRGHRVAWVEAEEDIRGTLRDRVYDQLRVNHPNLKFTPKHPLKVDLTGFEFVVINSVSELRLKPDELRSLKEKWPQTNFLFIYHSLKDGDDFRGEATHGNLMDMIVTVRKKDKSVRTEGRYGVGRGEVLFTAEDIAAA